jgi:hypothetical protein
MLLEDMSRNIISRFEYHIFYVLFPFVTYLLTLYRTLTLIQSIISSFYKTLHAMVIYFKQSLRVNLMYLKVLDVSYLF